MNIKVSRLFLRIYYVAQLGNLKKNNGSLLYLVIFHKTEVQMSSSLWKNVQPHQDQKLGPPACPTEALPAELSKPPDNDQYIPHLFYSGNVANRFANVCYRQVSSDEHPSQRTAQVGSNGNSSRRSPPPIKCQQCWENVQPRPRLVLRALTGRADALSTELPRLLMPL